MRRFSISTPRPASALYLLLLAQLVVVGAASVSGCGAASRMRAQQVQNHDSLEQMHNRAYRCMPKALALADSHNEMAQWEISQGDYARAKKHLEYATAQAEDAEVNSRAPICLGDRDGDGYPDAQDSCPDDPENFNSFQDEDGCPEGDRDGDKILDPVDKCPDVPENYNNIEDTDGCPENDRDGDTILDTDDQCPTDPEDFDQFEDIDGCPDPDNDKDQVCEPFVTERGEAEKYKQICQFSDACPMDPEDRDSFKDSDGCPDPDNDEDKIVDATDQCPGTDTEASDAAWPKNTAEQYNGRADEDGCPEVTLGVDKINITEEVYFATNKTEVLPQSFSLLDDIATLLKDYPSIHIRIEGHTDDRGSNKANKKLSDGRAASVRSELMKRGIDSGRLESVGYGEERPSVEIKGLKKQALDDARAKNRRVVFAITAR